jgi:molybdenum cofactor synthesis domain-containing protein
MIDTTQQNPNSFRVGILTVSDSGSTGKRANDLSGDTISEMISSAGMEEVVRDIVADEERPLSDLLITWSDGGEMDAILTTGGTGLGPRDVTPEATRSVLDIEIPGIPEAMRTETVKKTPFAMLSRSVSGVRSGCLIINLPGSPKGVRECLEIVITTLPHALEMIRGWRTH